MRLVTHIELEDFELETIRELATAAGTTAEAYILDALGLNVERPPEDEQRATHEAQQKDLPNGPEPAQAAPETPDDIAFDVYAKSLTEEELEGEIEALAAEIERTREELERRKKADE
jgi:HAMP domain-containing protein